MTIKEFKTKIVIEDAGSNSRKLSISDGTWVHSKTYQNTVNSVENMINDFIVSTYDTFGNIPF